MKNSRNENLSNHLLNMDEDLIENAYNVDSAEKMRQYAKTKNKKRNNTSSYFAKIAVVAAAFALIVGAIFAIPALFEQGFDPIFGDNGREEDPLPPWTYEEGGSVVINSIDSLNYYSAMLILSNVDTKNELKSDAYEAPSAANNFEFVSEDIYYYELDPDEVFTVSKVTFFRINVTDKNGFLASKVGLGVVDVVITENSLDNMITFKNGDRFFSCLENGWAPEYHDFSTHKYIEGFCIVKNLEQENFSFYVSNNKNEEIIGFECRSSGGGQKFRDEKCDIVSQTYVSDSEAAFTVSDLQKYFKNEDIIQPDNTLLSVCSNGSYNFEFYSDNTFIYRSADENAAFYKMGDYVFEEDKVILSFKFGEEVIEQAQCELLDGENGFLYNGDKYIALEPTGGDQN